MLYFTQRVILIALSEYAMTVLCVSVERTHLPTGLAVLSAEHCGAAQLVIWVHSPPPLVTESGSSFCEASVLHNN